MEYQEQEITLPTQVSYNLSEAKIGLIANKLSEAIYYYSKGKHKKAFFSLKCIRMLIDNHLDKDEIKEVIRIESTPFRNKDEINIPKYFEIYFSKINILLKKYGFDIKEKTDSNRL